MLIKIVTGWVLMLPLLSMAQVKQEFDPTRPALAAEQPSGQNAQASKWQLDAIFYNEQQQRAVINGVAVTPGTTLQGGKVVAIEPSAVVILTLHNQQQHRLTLALPGVIKRNVSNSY